MFNAQTVPNLVTPEEAERIINLVKEIEPWDHPGDFLWSNRTINARTIYEKYDKEIGLLLYDIRNRVGKAVKETYGLKEAYPDLFQVTRWFPGTEEKPHADDMTNSPYDYDNWYKYREFGTIIYLNANYTGGHTYYPNQGFDITPEVGKLAMHPGDPEHLHGVTEVGENIRYTLVSFWTQDRQYFDEWIIK